MRTGPSCLACARALAGVIVVVAAACGDASPGTNNPPAPVKAATESPAAAGGSTPMSGTLMCPIPSRNPAGTSTVYPVGPQPCDVATLGEACRFAVLTQEHCTWTGITLGGQPLTSSVMHGQGYLQGEIGRVASGYDWGTLPNGDSYLARWNEQLDLQSGKVSATWTLVLGTGTLKGITGQAKFACATPAPTDLVETCTVTGSYSLPGTP